MRNLKTLIWHIVLTLMVVVVLPLGFVHAEIETVTVECGVNKCFILGQPNIETFENLSAYIEQAHARLTVVDQSLIVDAVVTFIKPVSFIEIDQYVQGKNVSNVSIRNISESAGELSLEYPLVENKTESIEAVDSYNDIVSMKLTSDVASLISMTLNRNILCVDAGPIDQLSRYSNAMVIVGEDLYQSFFQPQSLGKESLDMTPGTYSLSQNYPNPFNPQTEISFSLPEAIEVKLEVYNTLGQLVTVLFEGELEAGVHSYKWDGTSSASGMYFYRLTTNDYSSTKKMLLLK